MITMHQYAAGEVIFSENDVGETTYIIARGRVEVLKMLDGKNVHLAYIGAGEPFGEMGMIDEKPRSATVVAVEDNLLKGASVQAVQNLNLALGLPETSGIL